MPTRRVIIIRLLISLAILLSLTACDFQSKYFRKVDLNLVNRWVAPYHGFNLELNVAGIDVGFFPEGGFGAGMEAVDLNIFYSLAFGAYLHAGVPAFTAKEIGGHSPSWIPTAGIIYQPVASWILKPYLKLGAGGVQWASDGVTERWSPLVEGSLGLATAFNYRMSLDLYVARDLRPVAGQDPWIMAVRLNLIGFSLVAFKPDREMRDRGRHIGDDLR